MSDLIRREDAIAEVLAYLCSSPAHDEELLRRDMEQLIRALPVVTVQTQIDLAVAVAAERERCALVALKEGEPMERGARFYMPPRTDADDALYQMHTGGAQAALLIAAAIRKGGQP
jgi:hypothetical protein